MDWNAQWIRPVKDMGDVCPVFSVDFSCLKTVKNAVLKVTAIGVYEAVLNGRRVGDFIMVIRRFGRRYGQILFYRIRHLRNVKKLGYIREHNNQNSQRNEGYYNNAEGLVRIDDPEDTNFDGYGKSGLVCTVNKARADQDQRDQ